jgi:hypothetical protein
VELRHRHLEFRSSGVRGGREKVVARIESDFPLK